MQFKSIWLYTLLTVVSTVVSSVGFGQTAPAAAPSDFAAKAEYCALPAHGGFSSERDCMAQYASGSGGNECTKLQEDYSKQHGELLAACRDVSISSAPKCYESFATCNNGDYEDADEGDSGPGNASRPPIEKGKYEACPSTALPVAKEAKAELKELRDEKKELEKDVAQKKIDAVAIENKILVANAKLAEDLTKREQEYTEKVRELTAGETTEYDELTAQITQLQNEIINMEASKPTLMIEYYEQITTIEGICVAEAERELAKKREDQVKALTSSSQKQPSLSALLKLRAKGRSSADEEYRRNAIGRCQLNPDRYKNKVEALNRRLVDRQRLLQEEIKKRGEALAGLYKKRSELNPKNKVKLDDAERAYQKDIGNLTGANKALVGSCGPASPNIGQNSVQNGGSNCSGLSAELNLERQAEQKARADLLETENNIAYNLELFNTAKRATGGNTSGATSAQDISGAGAEVMNLLKRMIDQCGRIAGAPASGTSGDLNANGIEWNKQLRALSDGKDSLVNIVLPASGGSSAPASRPNGQLVTPTSPTGGPGAN